MSLHYSYETLLAFANAIKSKTLFTLPPRDPFIFYMEYQGEVVSKERPRFGKAGNTYTPKKTRDFETAVKQAARNALKREKAQLIPFFSYPVRVDLEIYDTVAAKWKQDGHTDHFKYLFPSRGNDMDNRTKAVLDALNRILWNDDKQVRCLRLATKVSPVPGFKLSASFLNMLSKQETDRLEAILRSGE